MKIIFSLFLSFVILTSCNNKSPDKNISQAELSEKLTKMNMLLVENESKKIDNFIRRRTFKTTRTGTGLRYEIYEHGKGEKPSFRSEVEINYDVYLLGGDLCYSSDTTGPIKLMLGIGEQVSGLEEGLMLMVPGDKARLILPAHLAYGMNGDAMKIPPASALYFDVELLKVIK